MEKIPLHEVRLFEADKFAKRVLFRQGGGTALVLHFLPGQALPPHRHPGMTVFVLVLEGSGTLTTDGAETAVKAEDAICCRGDELFSFANTGSAPARLYVVLSATPDAP